MSCWILASWPNPDWWQSILALFVLKVDHNMWVSACLFIFWGLTTGSLWDSDLGICLTRNAKFQCNDLQATSLSLLPCDMVLHQAQNAQIIKKCIIHFSWICSFTVFKPLYWSFFGCNILWSNCIACEAILMQSNDFCTSLFEGNHC